MKGVLSVAALLLAVATAPAVHAEQKAGVVVADSVEAIVTVVAVDREARVVTIRGPEGRTAIINVPKEAQNLDQVKPGSKFKLTYLSSVALSLRKGTGTPSASQNEKVQLAKKGETPGGTAVRVREINAVVEAMDPAKRSLTLKGPEGGSVELKVREDVKAYSEVKVGDTVTVSYTEGLAMKMLPPQQ
jgi:hypothetical protein